MLMDCYGEADYIAVIIHLAKCGKSAHQGITQGTSAAIDITLAFTRGRAGCQL